MFQDDFTPELYFLSLSFGIFSVLSTGRFSYNIEVSLMYYRQLTNILPTDPQLLAD